MHTFCFEKIDMRHLVFSLATAAGLFCHSPSLAQLVSERADGNQRVCVYAAGNNVISGQPQREYRVGLAQNCPMSPPTLRAASAPPTARLISDRVLGAVRTCVYEQGGMTWAASLPLASLCPPAWGMIPTESPRPRPRRR